MFAQTEIQKWYFDTYFKEEPTESFVWRYSPKDLLDEFIIWLIMLAFTTGVGVYMYCFDNPWTKYKLFITILCALPALIYGGYVTYLYFIKRVFLKYELSPDFFTITDGFFTQRNISTQVMRIIQINTTQTLWERIIGVGTLILVIQEHDGIKQRTVHIRGIAQFEEMRNNIEYYRNYYRLVRAHAVISS